MSKRFTGSLGDVTAELLEDLEEGSVLFVKLGNDKYPVSQEKIDKATEYIEGTTGHIKNLAVIVTNHAIEVEQFSVPQLRRLQDAILANANQQKQTKSENPIFSLELEDGGTD